MFRGLAVLVRVLLLDILRVRNNRFNEIKYIPEFLKYFVPYFYKGTRIIVPYTSGNVYIVIQ